MEGNAADFMYGPHSCLVPSGDLHLPTISLPQHPHYRISRLLLLNFPEHQHYLRTPEQTKPQYSVLTES